MYSTENTRLEYNNCNENKEIMKQGVAHYIKCGTTVYTLFNAPPETDYTDTITRIATCTCIFTKVSEYYANIVIN